MINLHISRPKVFINGRSPLGAGPWQENKHVIFTGNGYSAEWPIEANKRGLPNLNTTPKLRSTGAGKPRALYHVCMYIYIYIYMCIYIYVYIYIYICGGDQLKSHLSLFLGEPNQCGTILGTHQQEKRCVNCPELQTSAFNEGQRFQRMTCRHISLVQATKIRDQYVEKSRSMGEIFTFFFFFGF